MKYLPALLLALAASAAAQNSPPTQDVPVMLAPEDQARLGVSTLSLAPRQLNVAVDALVRAVDPTSLASLDSDLASARAAAQSSQSELQRVRGLAAQDQSASQQALEAATAKAAADAAGLRLLQRRLQVEWGPAFADLPAQERAALIADVAAGRAALLRADAPQRPAGVLGTVSVELEPGAAPVTADALGLAGKADPRMQTVGLYCVVRGEAAGPLRPGRLFQGQINTGRMVTGTVIPRSAVVRVDAADWAYIRTGEGAFLRRAIVDPRPVADGWFVTEGFPSGTEVVEQGAGSLLAVERADETAEAD